MNTFNRRNTFNTWFTFPLITLGIYHLVWYYKINRELRDSGIEVDPAMALLAVLFGGILIVPPFLSIYRTGQRINEAQSRAGRTPDCSGGLGLVLVFVFGLFSWYYQGKLNELAD